MSGEGITDFQTFGGQRLAISTLPVSFLCLTVWSQNRGWYWTIEYRL